MHRLYDETCLQRWQRLQREREGGERVLQRMQEQRARFQRDRQAREGYRDHDRAHDRDRRRHQEEQRRRPSSDDDAPISNPFATPAWEPPAASYEAPPTAPPDPPSTIDPGGGSSGGGGASGDL